MTPENTFDAGGGNMKCRACWSDMSKGRTKPLSKRMPTLAEWQAGKRITCLHGHELTDDNTRHPSPRDVERGRLQVQCWACIRITRKTCKANANFQPETIRRIVSLIIDFGFTKHNLTGRRGRATDGKHTRIGPQMRGVTDSTRFNNWLRRNPKMAARLEPYLERNRYANRCDGCRNKKTNRLRISPNSDVPTRIEAALPAWLKGDDRLDVSSAIYLALADGKLRVKDIEIKAKTFIAQNRKQSDNIGRYGFNSLDAPAGPDNPTARVELLSEANRLWG